MKKNFLILVLTFSCFANYISAQPSTTYRQVFSDEFNGATVNTNTWWIVGGPGWNPECVTHGDPAKGCEEDMWYRPQNVSIASGKLKITAKNETITCGGKTKNFTSGQVYSGAEFRYGYFEISCKVPKGDGFWPAFWFWSGNNCFTYQELDVFEFCGCNTKRYQAGYYYDNNFNGIAEIDESKHPSKDININDASTSFNRYGVEWTPTSIIFYYNGSVVYTTSNINLHRPMPIILNLAVGGCYGGCSGDCRRKSGTTFPSNFEIEYVRVYQKNNEALYINGPSDLCTGQTATLLAPNYPGATYSWSIANTNGSSSGLTINNQPYLELIQCPPGGLTSGVWRKATTTLNAVGTYTVTLNVTFPSGYSESKTKTIRVEQNVPQAPSMVGFYPETTDPCCLYAVTNVVQGATQYVWDGYVNTTFNELHNCYRPNNLTSVSVQAGNGCGLSPAFNFSGTTPSSPNCTIIQRVAPQTLRVSPNPTSSSIYVDVVDEAGNKLVKKMKSKDVFKISNSFGKELLLKKFENGESVDFQIDVSALKPGTYSAVLIEDGNILTCHFVKM